MEGTVARADAALSALRVSPAVQASLRCPACGGALAVREDRMACAADRCGARYPVVRGIPVLVDDRTSVFRAADLAAAAEAGRGAAPPRNLHHRIRSLTPSITRHVTLAANRERLVSLLRAQTPSPAILAIGCGAGAEDGTASLPLAGEDVVETDIVAGPRTALLCDPQTLPFDDGRFDAVVACGVFQRLPDPARAAAEIHRVLKPRGLLYAHTPFLQPVHASTHDFQRFTLLGHRRLLRHFEEIESGAAAGPGTALAWAWRYFLWSLARSRRPGFLLRTLADFTSFLFTLADRRLVRRPRALDAAGACYFLGRRGDAPQTDRELLAGYRGAAPEPPVGGATRPVTEAFSEAVATGLDEGMERSHGPAVGEMLAAALAARGAPAPFTAVDAGCGNGWVVRRLRTLPGCAGATGVDASASMVAKARAIDPGGDYVVADLMEWKPAQPVDLVHSMEVLYYLEDPAALLRRIRRDWLRPGGWLVSGVDYYEENEASRRWPGWLHVRMTAWPEERWRLEMGKAGFLRVRTWRAAAKGGDAGTLAMLGQAPPAG